MVSRLQLVRGICHKVGVTRRRPNATGLSKRELQAVYSHINLIEQNRVVSRLSKQA